MEIQIQGKGNVVKMCFVFRAALQSFVCDDPDLPVGELKLTHSLTGLVGENLATVQAEEGLLDVLVQAAGHDLVAFGAVLLSHVLFCEIWKIGEDHWKLKRKVSVSIFWL